MPLASLGFLVGVLICQSLTDLPVREWSFLIIFLVPLVLRFPEYRFVIFVLLGFLYSVLIAHSKLDDRVSAELAGKDLTVVGVITHITHKTGQRTRFWLDVNDLSELPEVPRQNLALTSASVNLPRRIQLSWYHDAPTISVGQRWQLKVRLKQPRGFSNPGAFDYEAWLYQNSIDATGYVRSGKKYSEANQLIAEETGLLVVIHQLREFLSKQINTLLPDAAHASLIKALVVGDRQGMTDQQWSTLTKTGTNHLMAISGLHIGLIAGLAFYLMNLVWRSLPRAPLWVASPRVAAIAAIVSALIYAALAGFSLPTQRAFIMVTVVMSAVWFRRSFASSQVLSSALLAVLIYDPTSVLNGSFWLSFAAVAVILFTSSNRSTAQSSMQKWWWKWGRVQWVIAVGLAPILLFWFQQVPLMSPVANFIAVPVVSLITVPMSLLGALLSLIENNSAQFFLTLAHYSLELLWPALSSMAGIDSFIYQGSQTPLWTLFPAMIGVLWLLAPAGVPARWLGLMWLTPMLFYPGSGIPQGAYHFTLLDVGHGLAAVVQTQNHVLVYDAGPRYSESFNAGDAAVLPYLKSIGVREIDRLVLSHNDIDHVGGYQSISANMQISQLMVGQGITTGSVNAQPCASGQQWQWDGVQFRVLHPPSGYLSHKDNNNSCVVQISTETDKLLLTGDIEREVETEFVKFFRGDDDNLRADVLVVPHHGSLSSSSAAFVRAVAPEYALISSGYNNRFGLPKPQVTRRYQDIGSQIINTASAGAISFLMGKSGMSELTLHRQQARHYWTSVTN